jgi:C-terminal processing protease CtpA/Prc
LSRLFSVWGLKFQPKISGGDVIAELMKQIPYVTVVGDTTNGEGCTNHPDDLIESDYFLPICKFIHVGVNYIFRYDGIPIEWNGVPPEIGHQQLIDSQK